MGYPLISQSTGQTTAFLMPGRSLNMYCSMLCSLRYVLSRLQGSDAFEPMEFDEIPLNPADNVDPFAVVPALLDNGDPGISLDLIVFDPDKMEAITDGSVTRTTTLRIGGQMVRVSSSSETLATSFLVALSKVYKLST